VIRLSPLHLASIRDHAERAYPHECCGALLGRVADAGAVPAVKDVEALHAAENRRDAEAAARRFLISPEDYREIEALARERGLEVLGFYHSHPDHPARPSEYDREHAFPWYSYLIVSVRGGRAGEPPVDLTSWVLTDDRNDFDPELIAPPDGGTQAR